MLTVALVQEPAPPDEAAALETAERACADAARAGADVVLFPELWQIGYTGAPDDADGRAAWQALATAEDGPYLERFRTLARTHGVAVVATYLGRTAGAPHNSAALIDRTGAIVLRYAKVHTCDFNMETATTPGDGFGVATLTTAAGDVQVGLMICYDREFPEAARALMVGGAELVLVPNACPLPEPLIRQFRTRAMENMVGMAMANYAADTAPPRPPGAFDGHSIAVSGVSFDPVGERGRRPARPGRRAARPVPRPLRPRRAARVPAPRDLGRRISEAVGLRRARHRRPGAGVRRAPTPGGRARARAATAPARAAARRRTARTPRRRRRRTASRGSAPRSACRRPRRSRRGRAATPSWLACASSIACFVAIVAETSTYSAGREPDAGQRVHVEQRRDDVVRRPAGLQQRQRRVEAALEDEPRHLVVVAHVVVRRVRDDQVRAVLADEVDDRRALLRGRTRRPRRRRSRGTRAPPRRRPPPRAPPPAGWRRPPRASTRTRRGRRASRGT